MSIDQLHLNLGIRIQQLQKTLELMSLENLININQNFVSLNIFNLTYLVYLPCFQCQLKS